MKKQQQLYLFVSFTAVAAGLTLSLVYRPHIYENNLNDYGFADTIGSLVSVIGSFFFFAGIKNYTDSEKNRMIVSMTLLYGVAWELAGLVNLHGTFDWKDMLAALLSGIITFALKELIDRIYIPKKRGTYSTDFNNEPEKGYTGKT